MPNKGPWEKASNKKHILYNSVQKGDIIIFSSGDVFVALESVKHDRKSGYMWFYALGNSKITDVGYLDFTMSEEVRVYDKNGKQKRA